MDKKICGKCYYCRGSFIKTFYGGEFGGNVHYCVHKSNIIEESNNLVFQKVCANDSACISYKPMAEQMKSGNIISQSEKKEFILVQDNSNAWYVIPSDKHSDWNNWLNSDEIEQGSIPSYADRVGGHPCKVTFQNYRIKHVCCGLI